MYEPLQKKSNKIKRVKSEDTNPPGHQRNQDFGHYMPMVKIRHFLLLCCFCLVMLLGLYRYTTDDSMIIAKRVISLAERLNLRHAKATNWTEKPASTILYNVSRAVVTRASQRGIYIFTAFTRLVKNEMSVFINGWEEKALQTGTDHYCCYLSMNGTVLHSKVFHLSRFYNTRLRATLFGCTVHPSIVDTNIFAVSISVIQSKLMPSTGLSHKPNRIATKRKAHQQNQVDNIDHRPSTPIKPQSSLNVQSGTKLSASRSEISTVTPTQSVCPRDSSAYIIPLRPMEVTGNKQTIPISDLVTNDLDKETTKQNSAVDNKFSFAICAKLMFGDAEAELAIEWFEYNRRMGVSKVLIFTYNITSNAARVIRHYEDEHFLELRPFDFPQKDSPKRTVGQKNEQAWDDEQVVVYHCFDRLFNFKYVGIIDLDEFLVPHKDRNFEELFMRLQTTFKSAANFNFKSLTNVLEWKPVSDDRTIVGRYLNHSKPISTDKTVFMPDKVRPGTVVTHHVKGFYNGYKSVTVDTSIAQLSHYRKRCRPQWIKSNTCFNVTRLTTKRILKLLDDDLRQKIELKKHLLLNINP